METTKGIAVAVDISAWSSDCDIVVLTGKREEILTPQTLKQAFNVDLKLIKTDNGRLWSIVE